MQVKDLTTDELKQLIRETVLEVLQDYCQVEAEPDAELPDPDAGHPVRETVKQQLLASRQRRSSGERGISAAEVAQRFGMTWQ